jgi:alpha-beta hydrolase superfamily lysophospholipase
MKKLNTKNLVLGILFLISLAFICGAYGVGLSYSTQYSEGFDIQLLHMTTEDGYRYDMYQIMREDLVAKDDGTIPFVLVVHGLGSNKERQLDTALTFAANGFAVFVPDARGQGSHTGPFSFGVKDVMDLRNLLTWIQNSENYPMLNKTNIGIFGHSLGGMLTLLTAAQDSRIRCTIAGSAPSNITQVLADEEFRLNLIGSPVDLNNATEFLIRTPLQYLTPTNPPNLLIAHGTSDTSVPYYHSEWTNATVNPLGTRTDYQFIVYENGDHGLTFPLPGNPAISMFDDFRIRSVQWFSHYLLGEEISYSTDLLVKRGDIRASMEQSYKFMYMAIVISLIPLIGLLQVIFRSGIDGLILRIKKPVTAPTVEQKEANIPSQVTPSQRFSLPDDFNLQKYVEDQHSNEHESGSINQQGPRILQKPSSSPVVDVRIPPSRKELLKMGIYLGIWFAVFFLMGWITKDMVYPQILKIVIFPMVPMIPIIAWKLLDEKNAPYFKRLYLNIPNTIISILTASSAFIYYFLMYNALSEKIYSHITIVRFMLQATTGMRLTQLFWQILPGFFLFLFVVTLYFQNYYDAVIGTLKSERLADILQHWLIRAIILGLIVGLFHGLGMRVFLAFVSDFDLGVFDIPFTYFQLLFGLGFGLVFVVNFLSALLTQILKNHIGAIWVLALVLALLYVTAIPRVF